MAIWKSWFAIQLQVCVGLAVPLGIATNATAEDDAATQATIAPFEHDGRLETVLRHLQRESSVNIRAIWKDLDQTNITADTPVSIQFIRPVSLEKALTLLLADIGTTTEPLVYVFTADRRMVKIATKRLMDRNVMVQVYDVRDILWPVRRFNGMRPPSLDEVLTTTVDPAAWKCNGGLDSAISVVNGQLVVTTTPANHKQIKVLLEKLREIQKRRIVGIEGNKTNRCDSTNLALAAKP